MIEREPLEVGSKVYYKLEDYNTGEDVIYEGTVRKIYTAPLPVKDKDGKNKMSTFYEVAEGLGCQRNAIYTIKDLFKIVDWAEEKYYSLYEK